MKKFLIRRLYINILLEVRNKISLEPRCFNMENFYDKYKNSSCIMAHFIEIFISKYRRDHLYKLFQYQTPWGYIEYVKFWPPILRELYKTNKSNAGALAIENFIKTKLEQPIDRFIRLTKLVFSFIVSIVLCYLVI